MLCRKGQSLLEYGLISSIILALVIPSMLMLGNNLNKLWSNIFPTGKTVSASALMPTNSSFPAESPNVPIASGLNNTPPSVYLPISLRASSLGHTVQAVGANGTSTLLANSMKKFADNLLLEGQIDQNGYNDIIMLANQGHRLAAIESSIISAAKSAGSHGGNGFSTSSAQFDQKNYTGPELSAMIDASGPDVKSFAELQSKVLTSKTLNAEAKGVISELSTNILNIANASSISSDWMQGDGSNIDVYESFTDDLPDLITNYASATTENANGICKTQDATRTCIKH